MSASNQVTAGQTYRFGYNYNLAGQLTSETYPSGRTITTGYDVANRAVSLSGSRAGVTKGYVVSATYFPHGAINALIEGNNVVPVYVYNSRLQLNQALTTVGNSPNNYLQAVNYNWGSNNNNGNLLATAVGSGASVPYASLSWFGQAYSYDNVNRLNSFLDNGGGVNNGRNFGYDQYGNMAVTSNTGFAWNGQTPSSTAQFSAANQLTTTTYDAAGNQLGIPNVCSNCLTYDAENRQTGHTASGTTYQYDALGERIAKIHGSTTTVYVYDALGQMASEYTNGVTDASPCATCYLTWDHLGTTRLVTDQNTNVVSRHDYLPFGEEIPAGSIGRSTQYGALDAVEQKFTGQQRDEESQLDYFNARYYGGALGRFTSPDPGNAGADLFHPQSWNGYSYTSNNPLNATDPSGMDDQPTTVACPECTVTVDGGSSSPISTEEFFYGGPYLTGVIFSVTGHYGPPRQPTPVRTPPIIQQIQQLGEDTFNWLRKPRNPTCLSASTAAGASAGAAVGMVGVVGGPAVGVTEPTAMLMGGGAGWLGGMISCMSSTGEGGGGGPEKQRSTAGNMQKQVERGQAPKSVDRVDRARFPFEKDQVHFNDGSALNNDGTWKHGGRSLTNAEADWLVMNGWSLP